MNKEDINTIKGKMYLKLMIKIFLMPIMLAFALIIILLRLIYDIMLLFSKITDACFIFIKRCLTSKDWMPTAPATKECGICPIWYSVCMCSIREISKRQEKAVENRGGLNE